MNKELIQISVYVFAMLSLLASVRNEYYAWINGIIGILLLFVLFLFS